jgi:hypothetical protein
MPLISIRPGVLQAPSGPLGRLGYDLLPVPQATVRHLQAERPTGKAVLVFHGVSGHLHLNSI